MCVTCNPSTLFSICFKLQDIIEAKLHEALRLARSQVREKKSPEGDGFCWHEGDRTRPSAGSAGKMDAEAARRKAREMKAEALGIQGL